MVYTSVNNDKIKNIKRLNNRKYRDESGLFLVEGEHLVREAYNKGYLRELILKDGISFDVSIDTIYVTDKILKYISSLDSYPCVMGVCVKKKNYLSGNRIVVLDGVQDPGNLGTIIRSCVAFNVDTLVLSGDTVDLYNPKVIRATQGMLFSLNIVVVDDLESMILNLKSGGYKVLSTNVNYGKSLKTIEKCDRFVIIMGNEGRGVSNVLSSLCDDYLYIDMNNNCESLNVAVATSIILYELDR
ncbi:MAG: RNA methyltransferase [Bacilli bacterium]|nr:RNA methyltransferase [Bacilli bacterium]